MAFIGVDLYKYLYFFYERAKGKTEMSKGDILSTLTRRVSGRLPGRTREHGTPCDQKIFPTAKPNNDTKCKNTGSIVRLLQLFVLNVKVTKAYTLWQASLVAAEEDVAARRSLASHRCMALFGLCQTSAECCTGLSCENQQCCSQELSTCTWNDECCGNLVCKANKCSPIPCKQELAPCSTSSECCGELMCSANKCQMPCKGPEEACFRALDCCGGLTCHTTLWRCLATAPIFICAADGERCAKDTDCCGLSKCDAFSLTCYGPVCSNGILEKGEECDDGNLDDGDFCDSNCRIPIQPSPVCNETDRTVQPRVCPPERDWARMGIRPVTRIYDVMAVEVPLIASKFGAYNQNGKMFMLDTRENNLLVRDLKLRYEDYVANHVACFGTLPQANTIFDKVCRHGLNGCDCNKWLGRPLEWQQPLVIRANVCDDIVINFVNRIKRYAVSMHAAMDGHDIVSDGSCVGVNVGDATCNIVSENQRTQYQWKCNHQGAFHISSAADYDGTEMGPNSDGLFGAIVCEPPGSWWQSQRADKMTSLGAFRSQAGSSWFGSGPLANIHPPSYGNKLLGLNDCRFSQSRAPFPSNRKYPTESGLAWQEHEYRRSYREYITFYHDEMSFILDPFNIFITVAEAAGPSFTRWLVPENCEGSTFTYPPQDGTGNRNKENLTWIPPPNQPKMLLGEGHSINYRSEPMELRNKFKHVLQFYGHIPPHDVRAGLGEEIHHTSWLFGDPGFIWETYQGDPMVTYVVHGGVKETHVHHLHIYGWHANPLDKKSPIIDAQALSPQTVYQQRILWGGGSRHMVPGDIIFHCHLYPHFAKGMWSFGRVWDRYQDGGQSQPETRLEDKWAVWGGSVRNMTALDGIAELKFLPFNALLDRVPPPLWNSERQIRGHLWDRNYNQQHGCTTTHCRQVDGERFIANVTWLDNFFRLTDWQRRSGFPNFMRQDLQDSRSGRVNCVGDPSCVRNAGKYAYFPFKAPNPGWHLDLHASQLSAMADLFPAPHQTDGDFTDYSFREADGAIPHFAKTVAGTTPLSTRLGLGAGPAGPVWNVSISKDNFWQHYNYHPVLVAELAHWNRLPQAGMWFAKFPVWELMRDAQQGKCPGCDNECCGCPLGEEKMRPIVAQAQSIRFNRFADHDRQGHKYYALEGCEEKNCRRPPLEQHTMANPDLLDDAAFFDKLTLEEARKVFGNEGLPPTAPQPDGSIRPDQKVPAEDAGFFSEPLTVAVSHNDLLVMIVENWLEYNPRTATDEALPKCAKEISEGLMEVGSHVHLVKFESMTADGASTGYNYISGATFWYRDESNFDNVVTWDDLRNKKRNPQIKRYNRRIIFRWWADEEMSNCFFHDHPFANYRQKHGAHSVVSINPCGATFENPLLPGVKQIQGNMLDLKRPLSVPATCKDCDWKEARVFQTHVGDHVPMWTANGVPFNPPAFPGHDNDPGTFTLNYRTEPLVFRQNNQDVYKQFSIDPKNPKLRDPSTPIFHAYVNDNMRWHIIQGSHEESHSINVAGMYWPQHPKDPFSTLKDQQHIGISETFSAHLKEGEQADCYPDGDYLLSMAAVGNRWEGQWGIIRVHAPGDIQVGDKVLQTLGSNPNPTACALPTATRTVAYEISLEARHLVYHVNGAFGVNKDPLGLDFRYTSDPYGLVFQVNKHQGAVLPQERCCRDLADERKMVCGSDITSQKTPVRCSPAVLTARAGDRLVVRLTNNAPSGLGRAFRAEPSPPYLHRRQQNAWVTDCVSLHPHLTLRDPKVDDAYGTGYNGPAKCARPGETVEYTWVIPDNITPGGYLLRDGADVADHLHHGAFALLHVLARDDPDPVPVSFGTGRNVALSRALGPIAPHSRVGSREDILLALQSGLRLYFDGNVTRIQPKTKEEVDEEDSGNLGISYGTEPTGWADRAFCPPFATMAEQAQLPVGARLPEFGNWPCPKAQPWLTRANPSTPRFSAQVGTAIRWCLVGALDKARATGFTVHGQSWNYSLTGYTARVGSVGRLQPGSMERLDFVPEYAGLWAYRSTALFTSVMQGMWGIFNVTA
eukprot:g76826.t1